MDLGELNYIGSNPFNGDQNTTEARFDDVSKVLQIDIDADGAADMEIELLGVNGLDLDFNDFTVS